MFVTRRRQRAAVGNFAVDVCCSMQQQDRSQEKVSERREQVIGGQEVGITGI